MVVGELLGRVVGVTGAEADLEALGGHGEAEGAAKVPAAHDTDLDALDVLNAILRLLGKRNKIFKRYIF